MTEVIKALFILFAVSATCQAAVLPIVKGYFLKEKLPDGQSCTDEFSQTRNHLDIWNATVGSCSKVICFHGSLHKYHIKNLCRVIEDVEVPDLVNCERLQDLTLHYPDCCPVMKCQTGAYPTTQSGPVCRDEHAETDCLNWKLIGACDPTSWMYSNYTLNRYCSKTCGICT